MSDLHNELLDLIEKQLFRLYSESPGHVKRRRYPSVEAKMLAVYNSLSPRDQREHQLWVILKNIVRIRYKDDLPLVEREILNSFLESVESG